MAKINKKRCHNCRFRKLADAVRRWFYCTEVDCLLGHFDANDCWRWLPDRRET